MRVIVSPATFIADSLPRQGQEGSGSAIYPPTVSTLTAPVSPALTVVSTVAGLEGLSDEWLRSLRRSGRSPNTEKSYGWAIGDLRKFVLERYGVTDSHQLEADHIERWQDRQVERGVSDQSRSLSATAVRSWLQWMALRRRGVDPNLWLAVAKVRTRRLLPRPLEEVDLRKLLTHLQARWPHGPSLQQLRDRALIVYLLSTGGRISEVLQVTRTDFDRAVVWRKGGQEGRLMPGEVALEAIADYLIARTDDLPWLWIGLTRGIPEGRLTAEGVRHICGRLARQVGIPHFTPHQLRHSTGTITYDETGDVLAAADLLGHADLSTIRNYARVSPKRLKGVMEALDRVLRDLGQGGV